MWGLSFPDLVGTVGALIVVGAYFGTQARLINSDDLAFPLINLIAALLISYSLYYTFNFASALIEAFWILISLFGIWQWWRRKTP